MNSSNVAKNNNSCNLIQITIHNEMPLLHVAFFSEVHQRKMLANKYHILVLGTLPISVDIQLMD